MYRVFYNIIRLENEITSQDTREVELADVYSNIFPLMKEDGEFFGLIDSQGSFGSNLSFDAAMDLMKSLDGPFPKKGFEGFEFQAW